MSIETEDYILHLFFEELEKHLYIDDAGLGIPLKFDPYLSHRNFVDWDEVKKLLINQKIL